MGYWRGNVTIGRVANVTMPVRLVAMTRCGRVTKGTTMTIDALPGKARRSTRRKTELPSLAIGELDANIVACPACARPLDAGASKCPACGQRMIAGVRASRALGFIAGGLVAGLVVGSTLTGTVALLTLPGTTAVVTPIASALPVASALTPASAAPITLPSIPSGAVSAIRQSAELNQRLANDAGRLASVLAVREPSSSDLARILRSLSANAAFGERVAPNVASWAAATGLSMELTALYADVGRTARDGLAASLRNTDAYLKASRTMLTVLSGLVDLDAQTRPLAAEAELVLEPLTMPGDATP